MPGPAQGYFQGIASANRRGEIGQVRGPAHRSGQVMTITVGRLLAYVSALLAAIVLLFMGWTWFGPASPQSFAHRAQAICRQESPAITNAHDSQTALTQSREMRSRLSTLTPPAARQQVFSQWLADLRAAEKAGVGGRWSLAQQYDAGAQLDVRSLGLSKGCIIYFRHPGEDS